MKPNAKGVVLLLGSLSLTQAAERRRNGLLDRILERAVEYIEKRQIEPRTITVRQTITVGAPDAAAINTTLADVTAAPEVVNAVAGGAGGASGAQLSFVTTTVFGSGPAPTVTITALASTVTQTVCPGQAQGAAQGVDLSAGTTAAATAGVAAAPAQAGAGVPSGGVGVVIIPVPAQDRTSTGVRGGAQAAPPSAAPIAQNPAAGTLAPLPGTVAGTSTLQALPTSAGLQPLPTSAGLQPLPTSAGLQPLPGSVAGGSSLAPLPSAGALQPLPSVGNSPSLAPIAIPTASALDSTVNLGNMVPTPAAEAPGAFGGQAGFIPLSEAGVGAPQAAIDPTVTAAPSPGVANAGAEVVNIDVSGLTLNSQLNLGNLVQATAISATKK